MKLTTPLSLALVAALVVVTMAGFLLIPDAKQTVGTYLVAGGLKSVEPEVSLKVLDAVTEEVRVTVTYDVGSLTGFFGTTLIPAKAKATSVMRRQR